MLILPKTPSMRLDGRRALVAGASSGIGLGAAVALAEAGAHVTICARNEDRLAKLAHAIRQQGGAVEIMALDLTDLDQMARYISQSEAFDILVNSAGTAYHSLVTETTRDDFDAVSALNFRSAYFLAQTVAKGMIMRKKPGCLVTISSQMGLTGGADRAVYCATKHAVEGFTKAMAIELGPYNIRVNTICPTFIRTPLTEKTFADPEKLAWIHSKIKLGRTGMVEDIMGAVVYLCSNAAAFVTGTSLVIDGGWLAGG